VTPGGPARCCLASLSPVAPVLNPAASRSSRRACGGTTPGAHSTSDAIEIGSRCTKGDGWCAHSGARPTWRNSRFYHWLALALRKAFGGLPLLHKRGPPRERPGDARRALVSVPAARH